MSRQTTQLKPPTQGPPLSGVGASAIVQQSEGAADAAFKAYFENRPAPSQATVRQVAAMSEGPNSEGETLVKLIFCEIYHCILLRNFLSFVDFLLYYFLNLYFHSYY